MTTVGPLSRPMRSPVLLSRHHDPCLGAKSPSSDEDLGVVRSKSTPPLTKKERLARGRARQQSKLDDARAQCARLQQRISELEAQHTQPVLLPTSDEDASMLRTKLALSVHKPAAVDAANNAALAASLRLGLSLEHAQQVAHCTTVAIHNLAAADKYMLCLCSHTAHDEHPGAEAVASAAPGLETDPTTVETFGTVPMLNSASPSACILLEGNRRGEVEVGAWGLRQHDHHAPMEGRYDDVCAAMCSPGAEATASAATGLGFCCDAGMPQSFDIFDAEDATWRAPCVGLSPSCTASADAAAGVDGATAGNGGLELPAFHLHISAMEGNKGVGPPITTPSPRAFDANSGDDQSDSNSQNLAKPSLTPIHVFGAQYDVHRHLQTTGSSRPGLPTQASELGMKGVNGFNFGHKEAPGSSRPGSQASPQCVSYNDFKKIGGFGTVDANTAEIAYLGNYRGAVDSFGGEAVASPAPVEQPTVHATPVLFGANAEILAVVGGRSSGHPVEHSGNLDTFNSQDLANTCELVSASSADANVTPAVNGRSPNHIGDVSPDASRGESAVDGRSPANTSQQQYVDQLRTALEGLQAIEQSSPGAAEDETMQRLIMKCQQHYDAAVRLL